MSTHTIVQMCCHVFRVTTQDQCCPNAGCPPGCVLIVHRVLISERQPWRPCPSISSAAYLRRRCRSVGPINSSKIDSANTVRVFDQTGLGRVALGGWCLSRRSARCANHCGTAQRLQGAAAPHGRRAAPLPPPDRLPNTRGWQLIAESAAAAE